VLLTYDRALRSGDPAELPALQVLITRYNLPITDFRAKVAITDAASQRRWIEARLPLFTSFCLPSVLAQKKRPDLWLLGLDPASREVVAPVIEAVGDYSWIVPVWSDHATWAESVKRETVNRLDDSHTHVVLTRLDSDDAIHKTFFRRVAEYAASVQTRRAGVSEFWITFPIGADYYKRRCFLRLYPGNAFQSVVKTRDGLVAHRRLMASHPTVLRSKDAVFQAVTSVPMWLRNIHGGNVTSAHRHDAKIALAPTRYVLRQFGVTVERPTLLERLNQSLRHFQPRAGGG
jgi:Putative rhamnosyl transferase